MSTMSPLISQAEIFARTLDVHPEQMTPEVASFFLSLELSEFDRGRAKELAERAREGYLTESESQELDEYRRTGRLIEMMKIKAKLAVGKQG